MVSRAFSHSDHPIDALAKHDPFALGDGVAGEVGELPTTGVVRLGAGRSDMRQARGGGCSPQWPSCRGRRSRPPVPGRRPARPLRPRRRSRARSPARRASRPRLLEPVEFRRRRRTSGVGGRCRSVGQAAQIRVPGRGFAGHGVPPVGGGVAGMSRSRARLEAPCCQAIGNETRCTRALGRAGLQSLDSQAGGPGCEGRSRHPPPQASSVRPAFPPRRPRANMRSP